MVDAFPKRPPPVGVPAAGVAGLLPKRPPGAAEPALAAGAVDVLPNNEPAAGLLALPNRLGVPPPLAAPLLNMFPDGAGVVLVPVAVLFPKRPPPPDAGGVENNAPVAGWLAPVLLNEKGEPVVAPAFPKSPPAAGAVEVPEGLAAPLELVPPVLNVNAILPECFGHCTRVKGFAKAALC